MAMYHRTCFVHHVGMRLRKVLAAVLAGMALVGCGGADGPQTVENLALKTCDEMRGAEADAALQALNEGTEEAFAMDYPRDRFIAEIDAQCRPAFDRIFADGYPR